MFAHTTAAGPPRGRHAPLRVLLGFAALCAAVAVLGHHFREPIERVAVGFVERYGLVGMGLGTFVADSFSFPVPPQFYMLLSIAGGLGALPVLLAICSGSLLGGCTGFYLARWLSAVPFVATRLDRISEKPRALFEKHGAWAVVIASVTPIAYSMLCAATGALRLSPRLLLLACACRIPRLIAFYYLIQLGWS